MKYRQFQITIWNAIILKCIYWISRTIWSFCIDAIKNKETYCKSQMAAI